MRDTLIILNSFIHDMATGFWMAVLLMMYMIFRYTEIVIAGSEVVGFIGILMDRLWLASIVSLIIVIVTGFIRGLSFKLYGWTGDVGRDRKRLLFIKHIIFGLVFVIGMYFQLMMVSKV